MRAIKLTEVTVRRAAAVLRGVADTVREAQRLADEMERALQPRPKSSQVKNTERRKRATLTQTRRIYEAVAARAGGHCECGCGLSFQGENWKSYANEPELDHFFGRGRGRPPQSVRNCWMLTRACHRQKGGERPSKDFWLQRFIAHCEKHGFTQEAQDAATKLDVRVTVRLMEEGG